MRDLISSSFSLSLQALVFHLKNHYAMIFGVRELHPEQLEDEFDLSTLANPSEGDTVNTFTERFVPDIQLAKKRGVVRQVLTARKGQSPKHWIDWDQVRIHIANSGTYCIVAFVSTPSSAPTSRKGSKKKASTKRSKKKVNPKAALKNQGKGVIWGECV